jgi:hypothetical protein
MVLASVAACGRQLHSSADGGSAVLDLAGGGVGGNGDNGGSGGGGGSAGSGGGGGGSDGGSDVNLQASDFECILRGAKANNYFIVNKLGHLQEALAVANSPTGGTFPPGTIIQLVPNEASVKHLAGWNASTHDWEFFSLSTSKSGTTISARGTTNVVNAFGGNCFNCHMKAQPQWDMVCQTNHGCDPLPLTEQQIQQVQNSDPRCP